MQQPIDCSFLLLCFYELVGKEVLILKEKMADLLINNQDAFTVWGVKMGENFLDNIDAFLTMKDYVENQSRKEHGKHVITTDAKVDSREITLEFTITGSSESDYRAKKKAFAELLYKGDITIKIPALSNDVYKLVYLGKSIAYGLSLNRSFSHFSAKFLEPNPMDRS